MGNRLEYPVLGISLHRSYLLQIIAAIEYVEWTRNSLPKK
jgi:hypothetical protein